MWSIACYPSYTPEGGVPRARRIFRRYLPAEILTYLIINFLWAGLSLCLISTLDGFVSENPSVSQKFDLSVSAQNVGLFPSGISCSIYTQMPPF